MKFVNFLLLAASAFARDVGFVLHETLFKYMSRSGLVLHVMEGIPTAADFDSRRVTNSAQSEVVRQRLYDYQLYPAAGVAQLTFFSTPAGQGVTTAQGAVVGSNKTLWDTNIELGSQLPSGKQYLVESIECLFKPGTSAAANTFTVAALTAFAVAAAATVPAFVNDVSLFAQAGLLEFNILSKNYLRETPMIAFPPKAELDVSAAVTSNSATVGEAAIALAKMSGRPYYIQPEITLQPAMNFEVVIKYPAAVALPSGFNGRVGIILDGFQMRASQ